MSAVRPTAHEVLSAILDDCEIAINQGVVKDGRAARDWVLIADNSNFMRLKVEQIVDSLGYEPLPAADGNAALEAFEKVRPPIVLLDVETPEPDGIEVCRQIRRLSPATFIIMVTSDHHAEIVEETVEAGANDYVSKPFTADRLKAAFDRQDDAA